MDELDRSVVVKVNHSSGNLNGPIDENVWADPSVGLKDFVEATSASILHYKAEVGLLQTDSNQRDDVFVLEDPKESSLLLRKSMAYLLISSGQNRAARSGGTLRRS